MPFFTRFSLLLALCVFLSRVFLSVTPGGMCRGAFGCQPAAATFLRRFPTSSCTTWSVWASTSARAPPCGTSRANSTTVTLVGDASFLFKNPSFRLPAENLLVMFPHPGFTQFKRNNLMRRETCGFVCAQSCCLTQLTCLPPQPSAPPLFTSPCTTSGCWSRCSFPVPPAGGALWKAAVRCPGSSIPGRPSRCTTHGISPTSRSCELSPSCISSCQILKD